MLFKKIINFFTKCHIPFDEKFIIEVSPFNAEFNNVFYVEERLDDRFIDSTYFLKDAAKIAARQDNYPFVLHRSLIDSKDIDSLVSYLSERSLEYLVI